MRFRYLIAFCLLVTAAFAAGGGHLAPIRNGAEFENPWGLEKSGVEDLIKWRLDWLMGRREYPADASDTPAETVPNGGLELRENKTRDSVTWIGHATVLIQLDGLNIIADPLFEAPPMKNRYAQPGMKPDELPPIDFVLISHDHYDHLDENSLESLPGSPAVFAGLGTAELLEEWGIGGAREMDWWESTNYKGIEIVFLPARHWSMRYPWDRDERLWGSWLIRGKTHSIIFAGDTAWHPDFKTIGELYPEIDVALLPIGAYLPRWFMKNNHMSPEDAGQAFVELGAKTLVPIHWGTFKQGDDLLGAPPAAMKKWWAQNQPSGKQLRLLKNGETIWLE